MDGQFKSMLTKMPAHEDGTETDRMQMRFTVVDPVQGEIDVERTDVPVRYTLKPLKDLYGQGMPGQSVSNTDESHLPLLLAIEQEIVGFYRLTPRLTDAQVLLTLQALAINPEMPCAGDPLATRLQLGLRVFLSLVDTSRQEVRLAFRKIARSVERHTRESGPRGYVSFVVEHVPD